MYYKGKKFNLDKIIKAGSTIKDRYKFNKSDYNCPKCSGNLVVRENNGNNSLPRVFEGCDNYPKCKYTRNI